MYFLHNITPFLKYSFSNEYDHHRNLYGIDVIISIKYARKKGKGESSKQYIKSSALGWYQNNIKITSSEYSSNILRNLDKGYNTLQ